MTNFGKVGMQQPIYWSSTKVLNLAVANLLSVGSLKVLF